LIFYTLKGPRNKLEIHEDKLKLVKAAWWRILSPKNEQTEWKLSELTKFQANDPKHLWGNLQWSTKEGVEHSFRYSTNTLMMKKIELYMQKVIERN
jgi:hypothetical protein